MQNYICIEDRILFVMKSPILIFSTFMYLITFDWTTHKKDVHKYPTKVEIISKPVVPTQNHSKCLINILQKTSREKNCLYSTRSEL